jgi:RNA polymerase sigma-70 factor (ECF subfamily)
MPGLTAEQLVEGAKAYSQEAWGQLYDEYYPRISEYCFLRINNRTVAEDLASEVFLEALRSIRRYEYRGVPLSAWLYRIARNVTADHIRWSARRPTLPLDVDANHPALHVPDATESTGAWHDVHAAIQQLTEDQQQVTLLRFFQGLSHNETAAAIGRSPGAVRLLQHRALNALRKLLPQEVAVA